MNKLYIAPDFKVVKMESTLPLCSSPGAESDKDTETMDSNKFQGGLLWEDNDTEAE